MSTTALSRRVSKLTAEGARLGRGDVLDAAMAYPRIVPPDWLEQLLVRAPSGLGAADAAAVDERVRRAACAFLGLPDFPVERVMIASSAGLALDRSLATICAPGARVLTISPSIDIVPAMLEERGAEVHYLPAAPPSFSHDRRRLSAELADVRPEALVLGAPENPTGAYLSAADLRGVLEAAAGVGARVLVDQCAALFCHDGDCVPLLAALDPPDLDWVMVWDTGKTFDVGGEKLAFAFASRSLARELRERVRLVEFDVPLPSKLRFAELLDHPGARAYARDLDALVRRNRARLLELCAEYGLAATPAAAGSLQLVAGDASCVERLRAVGVVVVRGRCFFHAGVAAEPYGDEFLRVALARDAANFDEILDAMRVALDS